MTQLEYGIVFGAMGVMGATMGAILKVFWSEFQKKDNCTLQVESFTKEQVAAKELVEEKLDNIADKIEVVHQEVVKMNGINKPRVQT